MIRKGFLENRVEISDHSRTIDDIAYLRVHNLSQIQAKFAQPRTLDQ